jgi:hypothetical protein
MNIKRAIITPIWLFFQIPIFFNVIFLVTLKSLLFILRTQVVAVVTSVLLIMNIAALFPAFILMQKVLIITGLTPLKLFYLNLALTSSYLIANLYFKYLYITNCILCAIGGIILLILNQYIFQSGVIFSLMNTFFCLGILTSLALGAYACYMELIADQDKELTNSEKQVIQNNLTTILGIESKTDITINKPKTLQVLLRSFFSQNQYEKALQVCEDTLIDHIENELANENRDDFDLRYNYLLSVLVQIMISNSINIGENIKIDKIALTPSSLNWIDSPYFALRVLDEKNKKVKFVFSGTSVLPSPCPGVIWTHFADFVPLFSIGRPLMWFCGSKIKNLITDPSLNDYDKSATGISLGGCIARFTKHMLPSSEISKVITFSSPGELSWETRSIYFLFMSIIWSSISFFINFNNSKVNFIVYIAQSITQPFFGLQCLHVIGISICLASALISLILAVLIDKNYKKHAGIEINYRNELDPIPWIGYFSSGDIRERSTSAPYGADHFACPSPTK